MHLFVTGATGFVGKAVLARLREEGHGVSAWVRDVEKARRTLGDVSLVPMDRTPSDLGDAVINLAGEPVIGRWTAAKKESLISSRLGVTSRLVSAISEAAVKPRVLVSASAVGYYGDCGDREIAEDSPPGDDFLARLCRDWESAAQRAPVRVTTIRIGVVLGHGGALQKMLPAFRMGMGGKIGSGEQYMSWIHLQDLVSMIATAIADERWAGAINGTAPAPVKNAEFTATLASVLHRPAIVPVPSFALKAMFGEGAMVMTTGQRVLPARAHSLGFSFGFSDLRAALTELLQHR